MLSMYDKEIVSDLLKNMIDATDKILTRSKDIDVVDDFLKDDESLILLDSLCMQLIAIGEGVKEIDKLTEKKLLKNYTDIPWREISGMRDILSHHYFDLNSEVVFEVTKNHISSLKETLTLIAEEVNTY